MDLQELINNAREATHNGELRKALDYYNQAFDLLVKESSEYVSKKDGVSDDIGETRLINPKYFDESKSYLKRDKTAAVISNNMGVIFAKLTDYEAAEKFFTQAIELTPDDYDYSDPVIGFSELKK